MKHLLFGLKFLMTAVGLIIIAISLFLIIYELAYLAESLSHLWRYIFLGGAFSLLIIGVGVLASIFADED